MISARVGACPPARLTALAALLFVLACGGRMPRAMGRDAQGRRVVAVMVDLEPKIPAGVGRALTRYAGKRLGSLRDVAVLDSSLVTPAREAAGCGFDQRPACFAALADKLGAAELLHVTLRQAAPDACEVGVVAIHPPDPPAAPATRSTRCRLTDLTAAVETLLRELPGLAGLRTIPASQPPLCENTCTRGEVTCSERQILTCGDDDWDGCLEMAVEPCAANQGCSKGRCLAEPADMVFIDEGAYLMGSEPRHLERAMALCRARNYACLESWWRPEQPAHWVHVSGFWIDRTEVTQAAYEACIRAGRCARPNHDACRNWDVSSRRWVVGGRLDAALLGPDKPVICVTYNEARDFCRYQGKRLPTEAEWEKAARGTDGRLFPWGDDAYDGTQANGCDRRCGEIAGSGWRVEEVDDGFSMLAEVGRLPKGQSPAGAHDMAGNVWEWTTDWFVDQYYRVSERRDPKGPEAVENVKVIRGGSWSNEPDSLRAGYRYSADPGTRMTTIGFRCAYP